jgi:hypothetical protein
MDITKYVHSFKGFFLAKVQNFGLIITWDEKLWDGR